VLVLAQSTLWVRLLRNGESVAPDRPPKPDTSSVGTIHLPNAAHLLNAPYVLNRASWELEDGTAKLIFHERWAYIQPWVLSAIAAWGLRAQAAGIPVEVENGEQAGWAWRFGLHQFLGVEPTKQFAEREEAGRFVALRQVRTADDLAQLLADIVPLLHLAEEPGEEKAVQYALSEMTRNVLEHSGSADGAVVCAQLYPGTGKPRGTTSRSYISIGVADTGDGVRTTLGRNYPVTSDTDALLTAMEFGTTGAVPGIYGTRDNAGAGLYFTRRLSWATGRYFGIVSGDAIFRISQAERTPPDVKLVKSVPAWPGTIVAVEIGLDWELDFEDFVAATRKSFTKRSEEASNRARELLVFEA
jgi:hypothetical protein